MNSNIKIKSKLIATIGFFNLIVVFSMAQNPVPSFSTNQTSGCSPLTIEFTNTSLNASSCFWDFGNGNTSVLTNPSNVYTNAGTYTVKLIAIAINGQKDSIISSNLITVSSNSISGFYAQDTVSCFDGNIFSFVNTSLNSSSCLWDFGDGTTSTLQNPAHTYLSPGNYTLKLITYDAFGCPSLKTKENYIHVLQNPLADYTVNTTTACSLNQVFNFTSNTPSVNAWLWNFGDGTTSNLPNPDHTYNSGGAFTVSLTTTNASGCSGSLILYDYISVFASQIPAFTVDTIKGCLPVEVTFTNLSTNAADLLWDFGDGNTSYDPNPTHTYHNSGNYTIGLTITTYQYCSYTSTSTNFLSIANDPVSNFTLNHTGGCAPLNVQFTNQSINATSQLWEFGDGNTSTLQNPSYTYTANGSFAVTLHAFNTLGCEAIYQQANAVILDMPVAGFSSNFSPTCAPATTNFTNTSTNAVQWLWNFGDGDISTDKNPSHTYNLPGDYDVSLIAFDSQGCSDTLTFNSYIHVLNTLGNYIPPATINGCVPFNTTFSNTTPGAASWLWDFGDGTTSTQQNPSHTYIASGFYTVSLTIQLNGGCTQFYPNFRTLHIKGGQTGYTFLTQTQCAPFIVSFTGTSSSGLASSLWDFGDGTSSTLQNPTHTYSNSGFYTVKYSSTTIDGCSSTIIKANGMNFIPCPSDITNTDDNEDGNETGNPGNGTGNQGIDTPVPSLAGCVPFTVHFNNTLPETISWFWDFGDGNTSTLQNPLHSYTAIGDYDVKLISQGSSGQSDTIFYPDYIHASGINTAFSFTENSDCINSTLKYTGISPDAVLWNWDFGDGTSSILQNPIKIYPDSINNYAVTLTTANALGCSGSISKNTLTTNDNTAIWANTYWACTNQTLSFNCASSGFSSYLWDFGDGSSSGLQNPQHAYTAAGNYQVTLQLVDNKGCTKTSSSYKVIKIENPIADFNFTLANGCNSQALNFNNLSSGTSFPLAAHCKWNFGDGSIEQWAENPTHVYLIPGTYQVTLTVNNGNTCFNSITKTVNAQPIVADFTYTQNTTCLPINAVFSDLSSSSAVSWLWDFGDGATSTLQNPVHLFTVVPAAGITLTVTDANGCQETITKPNITAFHTDFWSWDTYGCAPLYVSFNDASFNANQWLWDFGDGTSSTEQYPSHVYLDSGQYVVRLFSNSAEGCADTMVYNSITVTKPLSNFVATNPTNCPPALVSFTDLSTGAASWLWDFGDGSTSVNQHPGHIYNIPGAYTIKLIVTNAMGCSDTLIRVNYIEIPGPIADFSASANQYCTQSIVQFSDLSVNAISWNWNFGDGNTSSLQNPLNSYLNPGQYTVSLIVHDANGCTSNYTSPAPVIIHPLPVVAFTLSDTILCAPFQVSFHNSSQNASSYLWDFGDGNTSSVENPYHIYLNSGVFTVSMVATNQFGCANTQVFNSIIANSTPVADFTANTTAGCSPLMVAFTGSSTNTQSAGYFWDLGNGITSTSQNSKATYVNPGFYSVSLITTNNNGCTDTIIKTAFIEVYDLNPPAISIVQKVTVVSDFSTQIVWNQSTANDFSYYEIYRKDNLSGTYFSIGTINNSSVTTFLDDHNLNTLSNSYCYKIQTVDICGYKSPLDSLDEHCTINITAKGTGQDIKVSWTPYVGANVGSYSVYRMESSSVNAILIATVPAGIVSIIDTSLACPVAFSYRIKANNLNGNSVFSNSDTSIAKPPYNPFALQKPEVVRSTVINNSSVLTEWKPPLISPEKVIGYTIYRSTDNLNFLLLNNVSPSVHEYIDEDVDINTQNYYYKINCMNLCDVTSAESNKSSSILLKAELMEGKTLLNWTNYEGWDTAVDHYIIEKKDENGEWKIIKTLDGDKLDYEDEN